MDLRCQCWDGKEFCFTTTIGYWNVDGIIGTIHNFHPAVLFGFRVWPQFTGTTVTHFPPSYTTTSHVKIGKNRKAASQSNADTQPETHMKFRGFDEPRTKSPTRVDWIKLNWKTRVWLQSAANLNRALEHSPDREFRGAMELNGRSRSREIIIAANLIFPWNDRQQRVRLVLQLLTQMCTNQATTIPRWLILKFCI